MYFGFVCLLVGSGNGDEVGCIFGFDYVGIVVYVCGF